MLHIFCGKRTFLLDSNSAVQQAANLMVGSFLLMIGLFLKILLFLSNYNYHLTFTKNGCSCSFISMDFSLSFSFQITFLRVLTSVHCNVSLHAVNLKLGSHIAEIAGDCRRYMCRRLLKAICSQIHSFAGNHAGSQLLIIEPSLLLLLSVFSRGKQKHCRNMV